MVEHFIFTVDSLFLSTGHRGIAKNDGMIKHLALERMTKRETLLTEALNQSLELLLTTSHDKKIVTTDHYNSYKEWTFLSVKLR